MNKDTMEGKFDQVTGAIKQKTGEAFGDQSLANSGVADQIKGAAKETWGKAKDVAEDRRENTELDREDLRLRGEDRADGIRDRIVKAAQRTKNELSDKLDDMRDRDI